jgi:HEAT repeat protein
MPEHETEIIRLAAPDLAARIAADSALHDPDCAAALIALLRDSGQPTEARWRAAVILGAIGAADALDALIAALADPSWDVRHSAAWALGALRHPRGFDPLQQIVMSTVKDEQIPYVAAIGLAQIDPERGLAALRAAADHPDPTIQSIARSALTSLSYR